MVAPYRVGVATASVQVSGAAPASDWAAWEAAGKAHPSADGNGFDDRWATDLALVAGLGLQSIRLGVEWARTEPEPGRADDAYLDHLREVFTEARRLGLAVTACLFDRTLPGWFAVDDGGFVDDRSRSRNWPRYVATCAERLGDVVDAWLPVARPAAWARAGWLDGTMPPGRHDREKFSLALRGVVLAQRDAWRELRGGGPPVTSLHGLAPAIAARRTPKAEIAVRETDDIVWRSWILALRDGVVAVPGRGDEQVADLAGSVDVVGVSYLGAVTVDEDGALGPYPPGARRSDAGVSPFTEGLGHVLRRVAEEAPDRPIVVERTLGTHDDEWRREILSETLDVVTQAVDDRVPVTEVRWYGAVDGYEPGMGFAVPHGLIDRGRGVRDSGGWLAEWLSAR